MRDVVQLLVCQGVPAEHVASNIPLAPEPVVTALTFHAAGDTGSRGA